MKLVYRRARRPLELADEDGVALVVALLVTLISFILATVVLAQAVHNVTQSGYLRRRLAAVHAAEAGLNWYTNYMASASVGALNSWTSGSGTDSGWWLKTVSDVSAPPDKARFSLRVRYVADNPCLVTPCVATGADPLSGIPPDPFYAIVQSIGCAGSNASNANVYLQRCPGGVTRILESAVRLHPGVSEASAAGGLLGTSLCFDSSGSLEISGSVWATVPGSFPPYSGYPCTQAGVAVGGGGNISLKIRDGSLYVDGPAGLTVSSAGVLQVAGDVLAAGPVNLLKNGTPPASCGNTDTCVFRDVYYGGSVTIGPGVLLGGITEPAPPISIAFPPLYYQESSFPADLWQSRITVSTAAAALAAAQAATDDQLIRLTDGSAGCTADENLAFPDSTDVQLAYGVTIVSDCGFAIGQTDRISGPGSLVLESAWPGTRESPGAAPSCGVSGATEREIRIENNPDIGVPLAIYTPCVLFLQNNASVPIAGQFVARYILINQQVALSNSGTFTSQIPSLPGIVRGFALDVRYIKEIQRP